MEFNEKLQNLRKQKGLTQEELAEALYVSRTAISKWESGRGYPNIDSLKMIARFFSVSIDELLSGNELLSIAEEDGKQKENRLYDMIFGLLDISVATFFFLPLFGQKNGEIIQSVSLLSLTEIAPYLKVLYLILVIAMVGWGIVTLALQNFGTKIWEQNNNRMSLLLNGILVFAFIVSSQPYGATFLFVFLIIKVLMLTKK